MPLITAQMVTGKITFVEKAGTGNPNGTGAYELDLTQISSFSNAWRQMNRMETDVFCSAGLILPDKAGRQLTVGGWNGEALNGVRLYWPDGSAGVKGSNQWTEDPDNLQQVQSELRLIYHVLTSWGFRLLVPRWYPSAMIMANGSILVVGGEIGNNEAEQPNLEILPKTGGGTVNLPFLQDTAPFNLYPYIMVVPTGIFILYYNEARILNEKTFATIKTLPNVPGAVNGPNWRTIIPIAGYNGRSAATCTIYRSHWYHGMWWVHSRGRLCDRQLRFYPARSNESNMDDRENGKSELPRLPQVLFRTQSNNNISPREELCLPWLAFQTAPISYAMEANMA